MSPDDLVDQRQSQTRPLIETRLKRLKDFFQLYTGKADAGVRQYDASSLAHLFSLDGERSPLGHGFQGVVANIPKNLAELVSVRLYGDPPAGKPAFNLNLRTEEGMMFKQQ